MASIDQGNAVIPVTFVITVSLKGEDVATIEAQHDLPITISGGTAVGDVPQITMNLDEDRVRAGLADTLRQAADRIEHGDA